MKEYDLSRYISAYRRDFDIALAEIMAGRKRSHWMWYIFPQIYGLGYSATSQFYAMGSLEEASAFLADPYLGDKIHTICSALLRLETNDASLVFGYPDYMKLHSSMTLFALASGGDDNVFKLVIDKFFDGNLDPATLKILKQ